MKKYHAVPRTKPRYNPALTQVVTRPDSCGYQSQVPAGGKLSCDYLSMRFSRLQCPEDRSTGHENERPTDRPTREKKRRVGSFRCSRRTRRGEEEPESRWFKEEEEEEEPREEAHKVMKRKRERKGRVSSSRQKQIAIVCAEPRQCRA